MLYRSILFICGIFIIASSPIPQPLSNIYMYPSQITDISIPPFLK